MQLVDKGLVPWCTRWAVISPGKSRINDYSLGGLWRIVASVAGQIGLGVAHVVAKEFISSAHVTTDRPSVGVAHNLIRIEAVSLFGSIGAIDAIAIELTR